MLLWLAGSVALAAGPALVPAGAPVVLGPQEPSAVEVALALRLPIMLGCVVGPPPVGHLRVRLEVGADGEVHDSDVVAAPAQTEGLASCVATQLGQLRLPAASAQAVATVSFALLPSDPIVPRSRLQERLEACGPVGPRSALALVEVERGVAAKVELSTLPEVDPKQRHCLQDALEIGPHRMGSGPRVYAWSL